MTGIPDSLNLSAKQTPNLIAFISELLLVVSVHTLYSASISLPFKYAIAP